MSYKVFLSHSSHDQGLVRALAHLLTQYGIIVFVADWYLEPGASIDKKVFKHIDDSDCVVVFLTHNGIRSHWVNQETGYAFGAKKLIIPLVEKGTQKNELAALNSKDYIEYDPYFPQDALYKTSTFIKSLKLKKEEQNNTLLVIGSILSFLLLLSGADR
ncbi:MAG: hypothetical protein A2161_12835 [Candidatus Schekmanbacteria bacterium RBG_13_48_7]|uniref:TIR domain-containing protein n=1 Tax=Candidatus Schekmanbacteria bacterium RBG_13_48_7 TaxID=1817878 RepID=A0A1F7S387_9BACT|nr:MAG: hypothetical protein A2161_12835 [Candidatus Schekmanbacteria bacterium RBG_13_48_7]